MEPAPTTSTPQNNPTPPVNPPQHSGTATAAMVVGIVGFVLGLLPVVGLAAGVVAVILGIKALRSHGSRPQSIVGIVLGALGALASLFSSLIIILTIVGAMNAGQVDYSSDTNGLSEAERKVAIQQMIDAPKQLPKGPAARMGTLEITVESVTRDIPTTGAFAIQAKENEFVVVKLKIKRVVDLGTDQIRLGQFGLTDHDSQTLVDYLQFGPTQENELIYEDLAPGQTITRNIVIRVPRGITNLDLVYVESYAEANTDDITQLDSLDDIEVKDITYRLEL